MKKIKNKKYKFRSLRLPMWLSVFILTGSILTFVVAFVLVLVMAEVFDIDWQAALVLFGSGVLYTLVFSIIYGGE